MAFVQFPCRLPSPRATVKPASSIRHNAVCTASEYSRRDVIRLSGLTIGAALLPLLPKPAANALSLNEIAVSDCMKRIKLGKDKAKELRDRLANGTEVKDEDVDYLLRYIPIWLDPARAACDTAADRMPPKIASPDVVRGLGAEIFGHLLELREEIKGKRREGVIRELDEFVETSEQVLMTVKL